MRAPPSDELLVRKFRQILLWPVQLVPAHEDEPIRKHWELLQRTDDHPWREVDDEFTGDPRLFQERHYHEFVTFLPSVQRFLYGDELGRARTGGYGESPMRVFRRRDVAQVRVWYANDAVPAVFDVAHIDLYFFYDLDIAILVVEIFADDVRLSRTMDTLFCLGRAYPAFWNRDGSAGNCARRVEWLGAAGTPLSASDYDRREEYLAYVCEHRSPRLASHWEYLLHPIASHHMNHGHGVRMRQLEYYRMPLLAYLAFDNPEQLTRPDFVRLTFGGLRGSSEELPYSALYLRDFEQRYCYDREWGCADGSESIRFLCCGHAFVTVGPASAQYFTDAETGLLGQFRHELFLLGLIAHFHKAALLMLSDRLTDAISRLDLDSPQSVLAFRRSIRQSLETFLRFTHRYWFHEVSDQARARELFRMWTDHLGSDRLYAEVREEIQDMNEYLEADSIRRQTNTVVRLTVVTTFGLIGTVATGFLGMNLIAAADQPLTAKIGYFALVLIPTIILTFYTVAKSGRLAQFLEVLSDERAPAGAKLRAVVDVWRARRTERPAAPASPSGAATESGALDTR
ncbi:MAG TPA: hypothetical protein VKF40_09525 [Burkholderiales bacterium]|nr:hypothetical protein [Burkholderiales bacterium]